MLRTLLIFRLRMIQYPHAMKKNKSSLVVFIRLGSLLGSVKLAVVTVKAGLD